MILGALVAVVNQGNSAILTVILSACHVLIHRNEQRKRLELIGTSAGTSIPSLRVSPSYTGRGGPRVPTGPSGALIPPSLHSHTAVSISSCDISPYRPGPACCDGPCVYVRVYLLRFGERELSGK